jgi:hypothetical protein
LAVTTLIWAEATSGYFPPGTTHAIDRQILVTQHDAWQGLNFDITQSVALDLCEIANLGLRKLYVVNGLGAERVIGCVNRLLAKPEIIRRPIVELFGPIPHAIIATFFDILNDGLNRGANARICLRGRVVANAGFQISSHNGFLSI